MTIPSKILALIESGDEILKVDLKDSRIDDAELGGFLSLLRSHPKSHLIETMDLSFNKLTHLPDLNDFIGLLKIDFSDNQIQNIDSIASNVTVKHCILTSNHITDFTPLAKNHTLTCLELANNEITSAQFISNHPSITALNLSHNNLTDISFLNSNETLTWVDLAHNKITIIPELKNNKTLTFINLDANMITSVQSFIKNQSMTTIKLNSNPITDLELLFKNRTCLSFFVKGESEEVSRNFEKVEERNKQILEAQTFMKKINIYNAYAEEINVDPLPPPSLKRICFFALSIRRLASNDHTNVLPTELLEYVGQRRL